LVQVLSTHMSPPPQTTPQPPQLFGSLVSLRQPEGQQMSPVGHGGPPLQVDALLHMPPTHVSPAAQGRPHAPQFFGSVLVLVHPVAQHCSPFVQTGPPLQLGGTWHMPPRHCAPVAHAMPHMPQLFGSVSMLVQPLGQHCSTPVQTGPPAQFAGAVQLPETQVNVGGQGLAQPPQLFGSVSMSVHPVVQHCSTPVHTGPPLQDAGGVQFPPTQVLPGGQMKPHWLQLFGSVLTSVHPIAQHVASPRQLGPPLQPIVEMTQVPPWQPQLAPAGQAHATPHMPQLPGSLVVSVQPDSQQLSLPWQGAPPLHVRLVVHCPPTHCSSGLHTFVQVPQCWGDDCVLMQMLSQQLSASSQPLISHPAGGWHALAAQACPGGHAFSQPSQLFGSFTSSTQPPLQQLRPFWQA
jgi:hypothetical protein